MCKIIRFRVIENMSDICFNYMFNIHEIRMEREREGCFFFFREVLRD